ncbi:helix-turn-helix domain-containing protein [Knoellia koreensis]|uniref:Helix-turn-helix domain-containing protein n=1 Tax=Knoellia koreensis TaxID=2730921 RepID=A0A849HD64_9MICO|nr:helix-turn-helix domain-containing protein [Knoellia sp. DB2414S]NNM44604.1 helix-turn-helix domain-containing protein [Knoellia sp. DB2414S]
MTELPRLITAQQLADVLGEHIKTVRKHTRRGEYDAFAINVGTDRTPRWRYDVDALRRWLDERRPR